MTDFYLQTCFKIPIFLPENPFLAHKWCFHAHSDCLENTQLTILGGDWYHRKKFWSPKVGKNCQKPKKCSNLYGNSLFLAINHHYLPSFIILCTYLLLKNYSACNFRWRWMYQNYFYVLLLWKILKNRKNFLETGSFWFFNAN